MLFDNPVKPPHDGSVVSLRRSVLPNLAAAETMNHRFYQRLFEPARHLGVRENRGCVFRQSPGGRMQPPQFRHYLRWGYNSSVIIRRNQIVPCNGFAYGSHFVEWQRHGTISSRPGRSLIVALAGTKPRNVAQTQFNAVPGHTRSGVRPEYDDDASAPTVDVRGPWQLFGEVLHPKSMQVDTDELRGEKPALRDSNSMSALANCRSVLVRISERANKA